MPATTSANPTMPDAIAIVVAAVAIAGAVAIAPSGGKAPGPQPLKECLVKVEGVLNEKSDGDRLSAIEVHDIVCHVADAVLAGGIIDVCCQRQQLEVASSHDAELVACGTAVARGVPLREAAHVYVSVELHLGGGAYGSH